jgi:hypothetical protein
VVTPVLLAEEISSQFIKIKLKQFEQNDIKSTQSVVTTPTDTDSLSADDVFAKTKVHRPPVPILVPPVING